MAKYSIRQLEILTGVKAATLRMWEKRYGIVTPHRTSTNIRYYTDKDLRHMLSVSILSRHGWKISGIAAMAHEEVSKHVLSLDAASNDEKAMIDQMIMSALDLEEHAIESVFGRAVQRMGFEAAISRLAFPLLDKIGILWQTHRLAASQEHFVSNILRRKLSVAIDTLPPVRPSHRKAVLFLPEAEVHELALLFCHYLARKAGWQTFYLGQNVPYEDVKVLCRQHQPKLLITSFTSGRTTQSIRRLLKRMAADFPKATLAVGGRLTAAFQGALPRNVECIRQATELDALLLKLS